MMTGWVASVELLKACWNVGGASLTGIHGYVRINLVLWTDLYATYLLKSLVLCRIRTEKYKLIYRTKMFTWAVD